MKHLKLALFSFICAIVFLLAGELLHVMPLLVVAVLAFLACILFLLIWLCTTIFHRFRHSLNVIMIIIFLVISVVAYVFHPAPILVESLSDFLQLNYISAVFLISAIACCVSILVLIARLIFQRKPAELPVAEDPTAVSQAPVIETENESAPQ